MASKVDQRNVAGPRKCKSQGSAAMDRSQVWAAQWVAPHRAATSVVTNVCTLIFMLPLNIDALNILLDMCPG